MSSTRRLPPLKALRALEAIHQTGSITDAAHQLNVSHSAISHQVKILEAWASEPLFIRQGRMTTLTDAGRSLAGVTHEAFDAIRHEMDRLPMRGLRSVSIACLPLVATGWLMPRLKGFSAAHPEINLHVTLLQTDRPVTPPPDIEIRFARRAQLMTHDIVLAPGDAVPVCAPALLAGREPDELLTTGPLLFDEDLRMWSLWYERSSHPRQPASGSGLMLEGSALLQGAAVAGLGVAICRKWFLGRDLVAGRLVTLSDHTIDEDWCYFIRCDADKRQAPEVEAVVARLSQ
jgi:LysR family glycine cleavage system transcriptional activator